MELRIGPALVGMFVLVACAEAATARSSRSKNDGATGDDQTVPGPSAALARPERGPQLRR